jgi:hypothetical protein
VTSFFITFKGKLKAMYGVYVYGGVSGNSRVYKNNGVVWAGTYYHRQ